MDVIWDFLSRSWRRMTLVRIPSSWCHHAQLLRVILESWEPGTIFLDTKEAWQAPARPTTTTTALYPWNSPSLCKLPFLQLNPSPFHCILQFKQKQVQTLVQFNPSPLSPFNIFNSLESIYWHFYPQTLNVNFQIPKHPVNTFGKQRISILFVEKIKSMTYFLKNKQ